LGSHRKETELSRVAFGFGLKNIYETSEIKPIIKSFESAYASSGIYYENSA